VYVVYVNGTKDDNVLKVVRAAVEKADERTPTVHVSKGRRPTHGQKTITKFS
jgi:phage-related baseplate assembly protein